MKKSILSISATLLISGAALTTSCNSPSEKVQNAEENVLEANQILDDANEEYVTDIENYRIETAGRIFKNEEKIAELKANNKNIKAESKAEYELKVSGLEVKNATMKQKMNDYKGEGKEKWENFKAEFTHDMDELGNAFNDLTKNNIK